MTGVPALPFQNILKLPKTASSRPECSATEIIAERAIIFVYARTRYNSFVIFQL